MGALSSASYIMLGNVKPTDTPGDLLEKVLEAVLRGVELGGKHDKRDVSKRICDLVLGHLQLLEMTHALNPESVCLLQDLEKYDNEAEEQLRERPEVLKQWLAAWESSKGAAMAAMDYIDRLSETDGGVLGEQGSLALIQGQLSTFTSPPPSVEALLPQPESVSSADEMHIQDSIRMLDTVRHMKKCWKESLELCSGLVRVLLQNVDTYTNETHEVRGQEVLDRLREMNNLPFAVRALNETKVPPTPAEVIKKMVETMGRKPFPGGRTMSMSASPGLLALWGSASTPGTNKTKLRDLLDGSPSRLVGVTSPQIPFGELKEMALFLFLFLFLFL